MAQHRCRYPLRRAMFVRRHKVRRVAEEKVLQSSKYRYPHNSKRITIFQSLVEFVSRLLELCRVSSSWHIQLQYSLAAPVRVQAGY